MPFYIKNVTWISVTLMGTCVYIKILSHGESNCTGTIAVLLYMIPEIILMGTDKNIYVL